jgi:hypothetical protein
MDPTIYGDAGGVDLSGSTTDGSFNVLPDVSQGAPDMSPSTPTGNGTGYFIDPTVQSQGFDLLKTGLNYALQRDALQMKNSYLPTYQQQASYGIARQQVQNNSGMLLLAGAVLVFFLMGHK